MEKSNKFICGIVTFFPDEKVIAKINKYLDVFDEVLIFDNTPQKVSIFEKLKQNDNVHIFANGKNEGLSIAYNSFIENAEVMNGDFLCTMDQDSEFSRENIKSMIDYISTHDLNNIAIIGPKVIYNNKLKVVPQSNDIIDRKYLISSGSFLNLFLVRKAQLTFDTYYFIDRVDIDFCQTCVKKGYRIVEYLGAVLYQTLGIPTKHFVKGNHSYQRHYYMFRNRFYYNKKFSKNIFQKVSLNIIQSSKQCLRIIFLEDQRVKKINQFFLAVYDYRHNIMGPGRY